MLKKCNKPLGAPPPTTDGVVRFNLKPKESIEFQLEAPAPDRFLRLSGRIRTEDLLLGNKPWHQARLLLLAKDIDGRRIAGVPHVACQFGGATDWTHCSQVFEIPDRAKTLTMRSAHSGRTGATALETPTLIPAVVRSWHETARYGFMILWLCAALACILKTGLWRLPMGWLIVALCVVILAGVASPKLLLSTLIQHGYQGTSNTGDWLTAAQTPLQEASTDTASSKAENDSLRKAAAHGTPTANARKANIGNPSKEKPIAAGGTQKFGHAILFAALGAVSLLALVVAGNPASHPRTVMIAIATITLFAASTEILQMLTIDRGPSFRDLSIDIAGACAGLALAWIALRLLDFARSIP